MPKYKTLTPRQKVGLIEKADKFAFSRTKLAEKHQLPLDEQTILKACDRTHSSKRSLIRLPTYAEVEGALITWQTCYADTESDIVGSAAAEAQNDSDYELSVPSFSEKSCNCLQFFGVYIYGGYSEAFALLSFLRIR